MTGCFLDEYYGKYLGMSGVIGDCNNSHKFVGGFDGFWVGRQENMTFCPKYPFSGVYLLVESILKSKLYPHPTKALRLLELNSERI